jgi:hypothetical protein
MPQQSCSCIHCPARARTTTHISHSHTHPAQSALYLPQHERRHRLPGAPKPGVQAQGAARRRTKLVAQRLCVLAVCVCEHVAGVPKVGAPACGDEWGGAGGARRRGALVR